MSEDYWLKKTRVPKILWNEIKKRFCKEKNVLDLGCACGRLSKSVGPHFRNVFAIDKSENLIQAAKIDSPDVSYFAGDFGNDEIWQKINQKFDLIISDCSIRKDYVDIKALSNLCSKYIEKNGEIIFRIQGQDDFKNIMKKEKREELFFSKKEIKNAFINFNINFIDDSYIQKFSSASYFNNYLNLININNVLKFNNKILRNYLIIVATQRNKIDG